jgi:hypothetical protein
MMSFNHKKGIHIIISTAIVVTDWKGAAA